MHHNSVRNKIKSVDVKNLNLLELKTTYAYGDIFLITKMNILLIIIIIVMNLSLVEIN